MKPHPALPEGRKPTNSPCNIHETTICLYLVTSPRGGREGLTIIKTMNDEITIREAQLIVDQWIKQYGVRYFSELTNMACLTEEVGELARVMARKYGDQSFKKGEPTDPADEMADVLWVLLCLANQTGVDLTEALKKSIEKKTKRDALRHVANEKLRINNEK